MCEDEGTDRLLVGASMVVAPAVWGGRLGLLRLLDGVPLVAKAICGHATPVTLAGEMAVAQQPHQDPAASSSTTGGGDELREPSPRQRVVRIQTGTSTRPSATRLVVGLGGGVRGRRTSGSGRLLGKITGGGRRVEGRLRCGKVLPGS